MSSFKLGFFLMAITVSFVSYYFTNLVNPIPKPQTADSPKEVIGNRTVARIEEGESEKKKIEEIIFKNTKLNTSQK